MNWDQVEGKWKQLKGSAKQHFGEFTDNDLEMIAGQREKLVGKLPGALWLRQGAGSDNGR